MRCERWLMRRRVQFETHIPILYPLVTDMLSKELAPEMRLAVRDYLKRVGQVKGFAESSRA